MAGTASGVRMIRRGCARKPTAGRPAERHARDAGGRTIRGGASRGIGSGNPLKDGSILRAAALLPLVAVALLFADTAAPAQKPPIVAAAANLNFVLKDVAERFQREEGASVELVFGASGTLTRQIRDGAPFELFLAADEEFPKQLSDAGLTRDAGAIYAIGRLAIFAPKGSPLTVDPQLDGLARLVQAGELTKFAIANPEVAPYGRAAEAVLRKRALWDPLRPSLVLGDTIAQAAQFAVTGNAAGGLVAYSLVLSPALGDRGTYALVPDADYPPLRQRMVLLTRAGATAERFYRYMTGASARAILQKHGFRVPQ